MLRKLAARRSRETPGRGLRSPAVRRCFSKLFGAASAERPVFQRKQLSPQSWPQLPAWQHSDAVQLSAAYITFRCGSALQCAEKTAILLPTALPMLNVRFEASALRCSNHMNTMPIPVFHYTRRDRKQAGPCAGLGSPSMQRKQTVWRYDIIPSKTPPDLPCRDALRSPFATLLPASGAALCSCGHHSTHSC